MSGTTTTLDERIDYYPTHEYAGFRFRRGRPIPFGATLVPNGVNFSVFSRNGRSATLVLFEKHAREPLVEIPFPDEFRIGDVFCMTVFDLDVENVEYGYRMDGPWDPVSGDTASTGRRSCCDPYAKAIGGRDVWRQEPDWSDPFPYRARLVFEDFDWEERPPARDADRGPGDLRDARPRLHQPPLLRRRSTRAPSPGSARRSPT